MKFFLDTAVVDEIKELADYGLVDGITTNPSLIKKSGRDIRDVLTQICEIISGPVSAEVVATDYGSMINEAEKLKTIAENIVIKLPMTMDGLKACKTLSEQNVSTNVTLCFSAAQALLAAKVRATYVSPFIGRLDDIGQEGMQLINEIIEIYKAQNFRTKVLVASIRSPIHDVHSARLGVDVVAISPSIMKQLIKHPLTDRGIETFISDWRDTGQKI